MEEVRQPAQLVEEVLREERAEMRHPMEDPQQVLNPQPDQRNSAADREPSTNPLQEREERQQEERRRTETAEQKQARIRQAREESQQVPFDPRYHNNKKTVPDEYLFDDEEIPLPSAKDVEHLYPHRYARQREPHKSLYIGVKYGWLKYKLDITLYLLLAFLRLFVTLRSLIVHGLSVGITIFCWYFNLHSDMPLSLLASAIIFPISFGLGYQIDRRERCLLDIAAFKADLMGMFYLVKDWENQHNIFAEKYKKTIQGLLLDIEIYLTHRGGRRRLFRIYQGLNQVAHILDSSYKDPNFDMSLLSRAMQYQRFLVLDFERIRVLHDFRTPSSIRSFQHILLMAFPLLFGPLWANYAHLFGLWAGIYSSLVSAFLFVYLFNITTHLEDPLAEGGVDHINIYLMNEVTKHLFNT